MRSLLPAVTAALVMAGLPAAAQNQNTDKFFSRDSIDLSFTTGFDFSSGDYGLPQDTDIIVVPLSVRATTGDFSFSASIPYLNIDSPGGVVVGPDGQPLPGFPTIASNRDGMGDLNLGASYTLRPQTFGNFELGLGTRVKVPTSKSSKALGTGQTDVNISAELSYVTPTIVPFVNVGYRFLGDTPTVTVRDGPTFSAGASAPLGKTVVIASYDYARASSNFSEDSHELFAGLAVPVTDRLTLTGYGVGGLSAGSPDYGIGLLLTLKIF